MNVDPRDYLTSDQIKDYEDYRKIRERANIERWSHWHRIVKARQHLRIVPVPHHIAWLDDREEGKPARITTPAPQFIAELMLGGVHPPIDAFWRLQLLTFGKDGHVEVIPRWKEEIFEHEHGGIAHQIAVDARRHHLETIEPMSYEDAIEFTLMKDVPSFVWAGGHNTKKYAIITQENLPKTRLFRNAWQFNEHWNEAA